MSERAVPALASTLEKLNAINKYVKVELGAPESQGWSGFSELTAPDAYAAFADLIARTYKITNGRFTQMRVHTYACWGMALLGVGSYLLDQRVPDISLKNLRFHWGEQGWIDRVALNSSPFYALPTDSAAADPDALIVADHVQLQDRLREQLEANIEALMPALRANVRVGQRALWSLAADQCVSVLLEGLRASGAAERCAAEVNALVHQAGSPLNGKTDILWVEHKEQQLPFLKRGACCFAYEIEAYGYCSTCPLRPVEERIQHLQDWLAREAEAS